MSKNDLPSPFEGGDGLPPWMSMMRNAAMKHVTQADIDQIVKSQMDLAKKGDRNAIKFVFDQLLGGASFRGATFVQNNYSTEDHKRPDKPSRAKPGSEEKIRLMRRRIEAGTDACQNGDGCDEDLN